MANKRNKAQETPARGASLQRLRPDIVRRVRIAAAADDMPINTWVENALIIALDKASKRMVEAVHGAGN